MNTADTVPDPDAPSKSKGPMRAADAMREKMAAQALVSIGGRKASADREHVLSPIQEHMIRQAKREGAPRRNRHGEMTLQARIEALELRMDQLEASCAAPSEH